MPDPQPLLTFILSGDSANPALVAVIDRFLGDMKALAATGLGPVQVAAWREGQASPVFELPKLVTDLQGIIADKNKTIAVQAARISELEAGRRDELPPNGFDAPVGTPAERAGAQLWPGQWTDANPYLNHYTDSAGHAAYHTGADLNLNKPTWDADKHAPVYAAADGRVAYAGLVNAYWRNVVILEHPALPDEMKTCTRYAHLESMAVQVGQQVMRGEEIGRIGFSGLSGPYHLHFDVSHTAVLLSSPGHWPGNDQAGVRANYVDPLSFIRAHRPALVEN